VAVGAIKQVGGSTTARVVAYIDFPSLTADNFASWAMQMRSVDT
jgi:hypothetical protein